MNYKAYLQGEHWKLMRRLRREVDNEQCSVCGSTDKLNVHHKTYERIGAEKLGDLITLCYECHGKYHNKLATGTFNIKEQTTVKSFQKKENINMLQVDETYSKVTIVNTTFDNYDLYLEDKNYGTIPNQRTITFNNIPSGLREFIFKCGSKEKKLVEKVLKESKLEITYTKEELDVFLKEVRNTPINKPLSIENKNILNKYLEIKEFLPVLEDDGYMSYYIQHKELLKLLISKGYKVNSRSRYNETPLEKWASTGNDESIYDLLINHGAKPTSRTLELALSKSSKRIIRSILSYVEFNPKFIYEVARNKNEGVLDILLEKGVDINYHHPSYNYPIHHFISQKRWDLMEKLISAKIDLNVVTNQGDTPFLQAIKSWQNESELMKLLDLGFSPVGYDNSRVSSLAMACHYNFKNLVKRLLDNYEFDINHLNRDGRSYLIYACNNPDLDIVELLLSKGADSNIKDNYGLTALESAVLYKDSRVVELLLKYGSNVNSTNSQGDTPLFKAVSSRNLDVIKLLLDNGADKTIKTSRNILDIVAGSNAKEILELLK